MVTYRGEDQTDRRWEPQAQPTRERLLEAIAAVSALHRPVTDRTGWDGKGGYDDVTPACAACGSDDNAVSWPCPTMQALGSLQSEETP